MVGNALDRALSLPWVKILSYSIAILAMGIGFYYAIAATGPFMTLFLFVVFLFVVVAMVRGDDGGTI